MDMRMYYFSYPFSDNPKTRTEEAVLRAQVTLQHLIEIKGPSCLIVPHITFNPLWSDREITKRNIWVTRAELEIIKRCDGFIIGTRTLEEMSTGMLWELAAARILGKEILHVMSDNAGRIVGLRRCDFDELRR